MKRKFRILALALCVLMSVSLFGGCKKAENGKSEKLGLEVWVTQGTDYIADPIAKDHLLAKWLEDTTGVYIDDIYGNGGDQWDPKLTKIIASGNIPNIVVCGAGQGGAHFAKLDELKQLYKLTPEMIKEHAPNLWEKTPQSYWNALTVNGEIMGIPYDAPPSEEVVKGATEEDMDFISNMNLSLENDVTFLKDAYFWIRDDVLKQFYPEARSWDELCTYLDEQQRPIGDELLDIPIYSTDEYVEFLYKIKNAGLTENGLPVYAFGYAGGDNWVALDWFGADMVGYKNHNYTSTWNEKEQKIEIPLVHDAVHEAAKIQNQMIADQVIDPESLVNTAALYKEKVMCGQYSIVAMSYLGDPKAINEELEAAGETFRFRPFITQVPAKEEYPAYREEALWNSSLCLLKTLSEEEVIKVLKWIDVQFSDEYDKAYYWGPAEAGLYEETADGKLVFKNQEYNDYFIEGKIQLEKDEVQGLQRPTSYLNIRPTSVSVWEPRCMHRKTIYLPNQYSGFKFDRNSEHVKNVKLFPPAQVWDARYAELPEVVTFWNARSQWEQKFTMALAAAPMEFETKWTEAVDALNAIINIEQLENAMTEVAKPLAEEIKNR